MSSSEQATPLSFFDLPGELRNMIYDATFPPSHELLLTSHTSSPDPSFLALAASHPVVACESRAREIRSYESLRFEISCVPWSPPRTFYRGVKYVAISFEHHYMVEREAGFRVMIDNITKVVAYLRQYANLEALWVEFADDAISDPYWSEVVSEGPFGFAEVCQLARIEGPESDGAGLTVFKALLRPLVRMPVVMAVSIYAPDETSDRMDLGAVGVEEMEVCAEFEGAVVEGMRMWIQGEREEGFGEMVKKCFERMNPNQEWDLDQDSAFVPLVSRARVGIVPLPTPTSEAQAEAMGPADQLALQAFSFSKPANAPNGVYDIVLVGSTPQYLAKTSQGALVLTSTSTGATEQRQNGQNIITSIFGLDCKGRITVKQGSTSYIWEIAGDSTRFTPGTSDKQMATYPLARAAAAKKARKVRRNKYTEGQAPRCPNSPPALVAKVKPGARAPGKNGCGPANGIDFVPDFTFGSCCDDHDFCFDNCEEGTFEQCNRDFGNCMRTRGCGYLDKWYSYLPYLACLKAADFYEWSVGLGPARDAFYSANTDRCGCYCSDASGLCGRSGDGFSCTSMFGSDVNNCGACGRTCSPKSVCDKGSFDIQSLVKTCPGDQVYEFSFTLKKTVPANEHSDIECVFGYSFANATVSPRDQSKTSRIQDVRFGPFDVGPFTDGVDGFRKNGNALEIPFTGSLTCAIVGTATVAFDNFELVPRQ
ncbi:hypothetical protein BST61_g8414 [Cercospora zeina]